MSGAVVVPAPLFIRAAFRAATRKAVRMERWVEVRNRTQNLPIVRARWCASFACRLRGLMLRRRLAVGEGLLLVERSAGRAQTAIHMALVFFPLGVIWLDGDLRVIDKRLALPWRIYAPAAPAQYVLEGDPQVLECVAHGDVLELADATLG
jgi:uncharacterized membrane protein (UPF0127 family)